MIKQLLSFALVASTFSAISQSFSAKYNFAAVTASTGATDPTTPPTVTGINFGAFAAVGTGTASTSSGSFTFDSWGLGATNNINTPNTYTGSIDAGKYYEVVITPQASHSITLTDITFTARRSGTGPRQYSVKSSMDNYAANLPASIAPTNTVLSVINSDEFFFTVDGNSNNQIGSTITLGSTAFTNFTNPVNFRFFAWNSEGTAGSFRIDSVIFNGNVAMSTGLGTVNYDLNSNFNVYPVPSHDGIIYIENKNTKDLSKIEVLDVLGNIVSSSPTKNDVKVKLNLADLPNGNYFVRMYSGGSVSTKKIIVIK